MKKKWKANDYYMGAMLLGVAALLCAAGIENSTQNSFCNVKYAVARKLNNIFTGIAVRRLKNKCNRLVNIFTVF